MIRASRWTSSLLESHPFVFDIPDVSPDQVCACARKRFGDGVRVNLVYDRTPTARFRCHVNTLCRVVSATDVPMDIDVGCCALRLLPGHSLLLPPRVSVAVLSGANTGTFGQISKK
jgi:hypothetical protein